VPGGWTDRMEFPELLNHEVLRTPNWSKSVHQPRRVRLCTKLPTAEHLIEGTISGNIAKLDRREGFSINNLAYKFRTVGVLPAVPEMESPKSVTWNGAELATPCR
jgi:hypothetical protein